MSDEPLTAEELASDPELRRAYEQIDRERARTAARAERAERAGQPAEEPGDGGDEIMIDDAPELEPEPARNPQDVVEEVVRLLSDGEAGSYMRAVDLLARTEKGAFGAAFDQIKARTQVGIVDLRSAVNERVKELRRDNLASPAGDVAPRYQNTQAGLVFNAANGSQRLLTIGWVARIVREVRPVCKTIEMPDFHQFELEIIFTETGERRVFRVPSGQFDKLAWINRHLGARGQRGVGPYSNQYLIEAVRSLSDGFEVIHTSYFLGWHKDGERWGWHDAGGRIDRDGRVPGWEGRPSLDGYELPDPPAMGEARDCVRQMLDLLDVGPDRLTAPLLCQTVRACLGPTDWSTHSSGQPESQKSSVIAAFGAAYGRRISRTSIPAAWNDTAGRLEEALYECRHAPLLIDDRSDETTFSERGDRKMGRIFRAQGNRKPRDRMRVWGTHGGSPGTALSGRPYGTIMSTGEELPSSYSAAARVLLLNFERGDIDLACLTLAQNRAAEGVFARAMAAYVQWLARDGMGDFIEGNELDELREKVRGDQDKGQRSADIIADLTIGMQTFLDFAVKIDALAKKEASSILARCKAGLVEAVGEHKEIIAEERDAERFCRLLSAAILSGNVYLAGRDNQLEPPPEPTRYGWEHAGILRPIHGAKPAGAVAGEEIWIDRELLPSVLQRILPTSADPFTRHLPAQLKTAGVLRLEAPRDGGEVKRTTAWCRRRMWGSQRSVLVIPTERILGIREDGWTAQERESLEEHWRGQRYPANWCVGVSKLMQEYHVEPPPFFDEILWRKVIRLAVDFMGRFGQCGEHGWKEIELFGVQLSANPLERFHGVLLHSAFSPLVELTKDEARFDGGPIPKKKFASPEGVKAALLWNLREAYEAEE